MKIAVIILGHGSRSNEADRAIRRVVEEVKKAGAYAHVERAFLQYVPPTPQDALERCARQKADRIVVVPFFLQAGAHVTRDIPELIEKARKQHPGIDIIVTEYVGAHPLMAKIVVDLAGKSECGVRNAECGVEKQKDS